jgi:DNA-binding PadR family transcriptional regulator
LVDTDDLTKGTYLAGEQGRVYGALKNLVLDGLVAAEQSPFDSRPLMIYRLTDRGRAVNSAIAKVATGRLAQQAATNPLSNPMPANPRLSPISP